MTQMGEPILSLKTIISKIYNIQIQEKYYSRN